MNIFTKTTTPVGELLLVGERRARDVALTGIYFAAASHAEGAIAADAREDDGAFADTIEQLDAYFAGERRSFELPLAPRGTEFQRKVWRALAAIPYGTTATYAEIARSVGNARAVRAVGAANGRNPLPIVVPCHRVIATGGALTGYAGGLARKRSLLALESKHMC